MNEQVELLKKKIFELGVATPYLVADALAGAFEITIDNLDVVKKARETRKTDTDADDFIDVECIEKPQV